MFFPLVLLFIKWGNELIQTGKEEPDFGISENLERQCGTVVQKVDCGARLPGFRFLSLLFH